MKKKIKVIAVLPFGPNDNVTDTIESIFLYMDSVHIIAIDDSRTNFMKQKIEGLDKRITVLPARGHGVRGGLWTSLANAYKYAIQNFDFQILLRIDTDALIIATGSEKEAIEKITENPLLGMLGSYKIDCNGDKRSFRTAEQSIQKEYGIRGFVYPKRRKLLHNWIGLAKKQGYHIGEHILGGANFQSYACVKAMSEGGFLDTTLLVNSGISEDFLFSILTVACGYQMGDLATGALPMGLRWKGLPDSPENLIKRKKKIIHSIKFWKDMDQKSIRDFFAKQRAKKIQASSFED